MRDDLKDSVFINKLKEHMFLVAPMPIITGYKTLSDKARLCYFYLLRYGLFSLLNGYIDNEGNPVIFPNKKTLGAEMGVSRGTISRYLTELENVCLIKRIARGMGRTDGIVIYAPELDYSAKNGTSQGSKNGTHINRDLLEIETCDTPKKQVMPKHLAEAIMQTGNTDLEELTDMIMQNSLRRIENKLKEKREKRELKPRKLNCKTLTSDFMDNVRDTLNIVPDLVSKKDLKLAKELIDHYGYELADSMFKWVVANWDIFRKSKRIDGIPSVGLVYGFRTYIYWKVVTEKEKAESVNEDSFL